MEGQSDPQVMNASSDASNSDEAKPFTAQEQQQMDEEAIETDRQEQEEQDRALLERSNKRLKKSLDATKDSRAEQAIDVQFKLGGEHQWDSIMFNARKSNDRPVETFNKLPRFIHEIVNNARMSRPVVRVGAANKDAEDEIAQLLEDQFRQIEFASDADIAYDTAIECAAERGEGFIAVEPEYCEDEDDYQLPTIKRVPNPNTEYPDPDCIQPDASDAKYWHSLQWLDEDDFYATWPEPDEHLDPNRGIVGRARDFMGSAIGTAMKKVRRYATGGIAESLDVPTQDGVTGTRICIAKYFEVEEIQVAPSQEDNSPSESPAALEIDDLPEGHEAGVVRRNRKVDRRVKMYWVSKTRVLQRSEWLGRWIPRARCAGAETNYRGKKIFEGIIRQARGEQRTINYAKNTALEDLGLYARNPLLVAEGQITGYEESYKIAHKQPQAWLYYKHLDPNGQPYPSPPIRPSLASPSAGALSLAETADQGLYTTTGIAPANLVQDKSARGEGHEIERQRKGEVATFHYADNLARCMRHIGRIVIDALPNYLDGQETASGRTEANKARIERISTQTVDNQAIQTDYEPDPTSPTGQKEIKTYNPKIGKYHVWVDAGPALPTRKSEAVEGVLELIKAIAAPGTPQAMALAPLVARMMETPEHDLMYDVLLASLPPNLQQAYNKQDQSDPERTASMAVQQLAQAQQVIQQMQQGLQQLSAQLQSKQADQKIKVYEAQLQLAGQQIKAKAEVIKAQLHAHTTLRGKVVDHAAKMLPDLNAPQATQAAETEPDGDEGAAAS